MAQPQRGLGGCGAKGDDASGRATRREFFGSWTWALQAENLRKFWKKGWKMEETPSKKRPIAIGMMIHVHTACLYPFSIVF